MKQLSQSEENYIKAIYALSNEETGLISTNDLADKMATKASSVTDMLKKLTEKQLLKYTKYQGCSLSDKGKSIALSIIRKHRLWEVFLVDKLQFGWEEVHEIAEQLEHIQSLQLTDKLEAFLGFPKVDPHGDPIPNKDGVLPSITQRVLLSQCPIDSMGIVMGVEDGEPDFLKYLNKIDLKLGSVLKVKERLSFDGSIVVAIDGNIQQFSQVVANRISVNVTI
jgi:DtxR family Mn-dependent transcriptional regulator